MAHSLDNRSWANSTAALVSADYECGPAGGDIVYCARGDMENRIKECQPRAHRDRFATFVVR